MKKLFLITLILLFSFCFPVFADRNTPTVKAYTTSELIKTGDWKIYRIYYYPTSNGGTFAVYDTTTIGAAAVTNVKTEGAEATALNGQPQDFTSKPLEGSTGLYLHIVNAVVLLSYE